MPANDAPPAEYKPQPCDSSSHCPFAYHQIHWHPQHRLALTLPIDPFPADHRSAHRQLDREPRMATIGTAPLPGYMRRIMSIRRRCSDFTTAAFRTIHDRYR